ncbi:MAG: hypothetical protein NW226_10120 [Microscillaceae bacterium]|nr:hypothetical protein [Microscillaceae bacterium]
MSTSKEDRFKEEWQEAFENAAAEPSPLVWSKIDQSLTHKKTAGIWLYGGASVLALLILSAIGWFWLGFKEQKQTSSSQLQNTHADQAAIFGNAPKENKHFSVPKQAVEPHRTPGIQDKEIESPAFQKIPAANPKNSKNPLSQQSDLVLQTKDLISQPLKNYADSNAAPGSNPKYKEALENELPASEIKNSSDKDIQMIISSPFQEKFIGLVHKSPEIKNLELQNINSKSEPTYWISASFTATHYQSGIQSNLNAYFDEYTNAHQLNGLNEEAFFKDLQEDSQNRFSYALNLEAGYRLNRHLQLRTGLQYLNAQNLQTTNAWFTDYADGKKYAILNEMTQGNIALLHLRDAILHHPDFQSGSGSLLNLSHFNENQSISLKQQYKFLSVPLELGWTLNPGRIFSGRVALTAFTGLSVDVFLNSRYANDRLANNYTFDSETAFRKLSLRGKIGLQLEYRHNAHWSTIVEPTYSRTLHSLHPSSDYLSLRPQYWGLKMGLKYAFF